MCTRLDEVFGQMTSSGFSNHQTVMHTVHVLMVQTLEMFESLALVANNCLLLCSELHKCHERTQELTLQ